MTTNQVLTLIGLIPLLQHGEILLPHTPETKTNSQKITLFLHACFLNKKHNSKTSNVYQKNELTSRSSFTILTNKLLGDPNGFIVSMAESILVLDFCIREKINTKSEKKKQLFLFEIVNSEIDKN